MFTEYMYTGMHNFFEAKGRKLETCRAESGVGWGFG